MNCSTATTLELLQKFESPNVTFIEPDGSWPIVWEQARGMKVWDATGREYIDFTAAFGVAAAGHANPRVVRAGQQQMARLPHAMGDVHPHALKAELARELSRITYGRWAGARAPAGQRVGKTLFCNSGFEAVEAALKTAFLATKRRCVIAFEDAYHGLGYGALNATHRHEFRSPFRKQLGEFGVFVPFPETRADLVRLEKRLQTEFRKNRVGAILVEPIQGRGGTNIPPAGFLRLLRKVCDQQGAVLICDEIFTGLGRTGRWFACEHFSTTPDVICLGKALTGGFPLSACVGRADLMDHAWPVSKGEAIHTSTFLGHPIGCAMALAGIRELEKKDLPGRSLELGRFFMEQLDKLSVRVGRARCKPRGCGLMVALELMHSKDNPATEIALTATRRLLGKGFIVLPQGERSNILGFTPPLIVGRTHIRKLTTALGVVLKDLFR